MPEEELEHPTADEREAMRRLEEEIGRLSVADHVLLMMHSLSSLAVAALEAYIREQSLRQQIQQLRIEVDEVKRQKQVSEIVDSDFFQGLRSKARNMRERRRDSPPRTPDEET